MKYIEVKICLQPLGVDNGPAALSGHIPTVDSTVLPSEQVLHYLCILSSHLYDFVGGIHNCKNVSTTCAGRYWTRGPIQLHSECTYHYTTIGTSALVSLYFISTYIQLFR